MNISRRLKLWYLEKLRDFYFNIWVKTKSQIYSVKYMKQSDKVHDYRTEHKLNEYD